MIDALPVSVDPYHQLVVDQARRALDEAGVSRGLGRRRLAAELGISDY